MAQMNVSIPEKLKGWADQRVAEGRYSSTSDYIRDLVRRDQEREESARRLQAAIDEGRASGVSEQDPFDYLAELRAASKAGARMRLALSRRAQADLDEIRDYSVANMARSGAVYLGALEDACSGSSTFRTRTCAPFLSHDGV
jgi:antitoxin ParD1/3/4